MGFYQLKRTTEIKASVAEVWDFISSPANLKKITPPYMGFDIMTDDYSQKMYKGMIISYKVSPLLGIKTTWVTEITQVEHQKYFIDEQRIGPYRMWHHQHFIEESEYGTSMRDIVSYQPPFGPIGSIANAILIKVKLKQIFDYREKAIDEIFGIVR